MCRQCRDKRRRNNDWSRERPTRWQPTQIENPESGFYFTSPGAWHFIADLLEDGHHFEELILEKPPGAKAYWTKATLSNKAVIYIKIQPSGNMIFGRSFHYDEPSA